MPVKINSHAITPAPTITFDKKFVKNANGVIGADYSINLKGDLIAYKGNPIESGGSVYISDNPVYASYSPDDDPISSIDSSNLLSTIMKKQEYIRQIFSSGQSSGLPILLEVLGFNSNTGIKAYCDVEDISFDDESRWTYRCGYSVTLTTSNFLDSINNIFGSNSTEDSFSYYISDASESWSIEELDAYTASTGDITSQNKLYSISHDVSAVGKRVYSSGVLERSPIGQASGYVLSVIGLGYENMPSSILSLGTGLFVANRKIVESIDELKGAYDIKESFTLMPSGQAATETVEISINNELGPISKISINGTITGLNTNSATSRSINSYNNANTYWTSVSGLIYSRANAYVSGVCQLNTIPNTASIGRNFQTGTVTYNYEYDNRPSNLITGALSEDIQVSDTFPGQNFSVTPVIGRSQPIIQYVNSRTEYKRSLQITAVMPFSGCVAVKPPSGDLAAIFEMYKPTSNRTYYSAPIENWNPKTGQYSYTIEWSFEG